MKKVIFTKGLPASGKSTWTKEQVEVGKGKVKRVNKDDIRAMMDNGKYTSIDEKIVESVLHKIVDHLIWDTKTETVIVDSCMFKKQIEDIKHYISCDPDPDNMDFLKFEEVVFYVTPEECIRRNKLREGISCVPDEAIWRLNKLYQAEGTIFKQ